MTKILYSLTVTIPFMRVGFHPSWTGISCFSSVTSTFSRLPLSEADSDPLSMSAFLALPTDPSASKRIVMKPINGNVTSATIDSGLPEAKRRASRPVPPFSRAYLFRRTSHAAPTPCWRMAASRGGPLQKKSPRKLGTRPQIARLRKRLSLRRSRAQMR